MAAGVAAKDYCKSMNFKNVSRDFQRVINYLEAQKELMDAHMVDFFTSNHWETLLPRQIREDLESLSHQDLVSLPNACYHESENFEKFGENLKQFLLEAKIAQLKSFSWLKDRTEFSSECKVNFISHIMTPKKSYEVEIMSNVVHTLATQFHVSKILDLGSGKGYLSQYLALQYGLQVIGVDSSHSNTENAIKRNERLLKAWDGLVKKSQKEKVKQLSSINQKEIIHVDLSTKYTCTASLHSCNGDDNNENTSAPKQTRYGIGIHDTTLPLKNLDDKLLSSSESWNHNVDLSIVSSSLPVACEQHPEVAQIKGTHDINMMQDGCHCKKKQFTEQPENAAISDLKQSLNANPNSFFPITGFVDQSFIANGELRKLFDELMSSHADSSTESNGLFLVGLHTCGDLVPMALRIFVNEPSVKLICIVGCCYHLVSQEVGSGSSCTSDDPGFPMSQFLKPFRLHVSRNATMVAQQAADRIASQSKGPPPSVLFRAILQVILKEKFGLDGRGMHVGKAGAKCKDFKEYVHKCLCKLGLQDRMTELSDEEVESYHERFKSQEKQLHAFHQLRAAIAPCIESVFLLDRLCYLHEQGFTSACIVRLFDPVKSPRCYAIIASKD